ncbi:MAG TPA: prepilin peptidase [Candidatus Saccharimonadales bacterium]|nr:prepilin peptidase [Candidatus Saccharimonadales bacterium]
MEIAILGVLGLCAGSFVNALVWRLHEQETHADRIKTDKNYQKSLSIYVGRSMCPNCKHELSVKDLVPLLSWIMLRGKCRYCNKTISYQYPLAEAATSLLFVVSYLWWPVTLTGSQIAIFALWLPLLTGLIALLIYDLRWQLLPTRIIYTLTAIAVLQAIIKILSSDKPYLALLNTTLAIFLGGGLFYIIYQVSSGKWIGGGDVRLGWLLGLIAGTPARSLLVIFIASLCGSLISIPLLTSHRLKRTSIIPFGPFLIIGMIIVQIFGEGILTWYNHIFLLS